jgi:hypothetical protein
MAAAISQLTFAPSVMAGAASDPARPDISGRAGLLVLGPDEGTAVQVGPVASLAMRPAEKNVRADLSRLTSALASR